MRETLDDGSIKLTLNRAVFCREAVLKAAYWATRDAYVSVSPEAAGESLFVTIRSKSGTTPSLEHPRPLKATDLADQFENSLIDFQLRAEIQSQTSSIRELILTKAFAESGIFEDPAPGNPLDPVAQQDSQEPSKSPLKILST